MHQYRLGANPLESNSLEKDLGVLVDSKLPWASSALVAKIASDILGCIRKNIAIGWGTLTLYSALVRPHLVCCSGIQNSRTSGASSGLLRTRETWSLWSEFHLNMRKNFTMQMTEHWHGWPRQIVEYPSLEIFNNCLNAILCSRMTASAGRLPRWPTMVTSNPTCSVIDSLILSFCGCWLGATHRNYSFHPSGVKLSYIYKQMQFFEKSFYTYTDSWYFFPFLFFPPEKKRGEMSLGF